MADGCRHGLVAQADLRAAVEVVSAQQGPPSLPVTFAPVVPAFQVLRHQSFLHVFGQQFVSRPLPGPGRPHCGVGILREAVRSVAAVVHESVVSMVTIHLVGRVDVVMALDFILIHVRSVGVGLHVRAGVTTDEVGAGCVGLARVAAARMVLDQVGHASGVSVHVQLPVEAVHGGGAGVQGAVVGVAGATVLQTGLAGVGRAVLQDLGAVAAVSRRQREAGLFGVGVLSEPRLRLQTAAAMPEAVGRTLRPAGASTGPFCHRALIHQRANFAVMNKM